MTLNLSKYPVKLVGYSPAVMGVQIHLYRAWFLKLSQEQARFVVAWKKDKVHAT